MKNINRLALLLLALLSSPAIHAQQNDQERDFIKQYDAGKIDGVQVTILLQQPDGSQVPVSPQREFKKGERIRVEIESSFSGYAYFVNFGSSGKKVVIFPDGDESNFIRSRQPYTLPRNYALEFTDDGGFEVFQVLVSPRRVPFLDAAIKNSEGELDEQQARAAEQLWKNTGARQSGIVKNDDDSRDPVWDTKKKTTVVGAQQNKGRTKTNKVAAFGVRLKNTGGN
jgi:hypothetical protein